MCSAKSCFEIDNKNKASTTLEPLLLGNNFVEIQPGMVACISTPADMEAANMNGSTPGDNEFIHLNYVIRGKYSARVKDVSLLLETGGINMGFSDGEEFHTKHCENFYNLALMIKPEVLHDLAGEQLSGINFDKDLCFFIKDGCPCQRVSASASRVVRLMKKGSQHPLLLHSAALDYLYWHLHAQKYDKDKERLSSREIKQLAVAKDYLLNDLSSPPTIAELAKMVGLNQCKLKKGFKSLYSSSIYAFFQEERMRRAMELLKNNNVTETAMILGYSNISHFSTAFRKQYGVLPREARRDLKPNFALMNQTKRVAKSTHSYF